MNAEKDPQPSAAAYRAPQGRHEPVYRGRFAILLVMLVFLVLAAPGQRFLPHGVVLFRLALVGALSAGLYQLSHSKHLLVAGIVLALPAIVGGAITSVERLPWLDAIEIAFAATFFATLGVYVLRAILRSGTVDVDTLLGGVSGYLLLVALFTLLHTLTEDLAPGSYLEQGAPMPRANDHAALEVLTSTMQYFSAVTATTLGYGDIVPVGVVARFLVSVEAILGQLYIAILLAGLVGSMVSRSAAGASSARREN